MQFRAQQLTSPDAYDQLSCSSRAHGRRNLPDPINAARLPAKCDALILNLFRGKNNFVNSYLKGLEVWLDILRSPDTFSSPAWGGKKPHLILMVYRQVETKASAAVLRAFQQPVNPLDPASVDLVIYDVPAAKRPGHLGHCGTFGAAMRYWPLS